MKISDLLFVLFLGSGLLLACNQNGSKDSVKMANKANNDSLKNDSSGMRMANQDDSKFMVEAANGGMTEVELGNVAQQKGLNPRVKNFGAMMVRDHTKGNDELKSIASSLNVTLPAEIGQDEKKMESDLNAKSGADFDKKYMDMMVDDHKKDLDAFNKAAENAKDEQLKAFASKMVMVIQTHLDSAKVIQDAVKKEKK